MDRVNRKECQECVKSGRLVREAYGSNGKVKADDALMCFVTYSPRHGDMEAHCHDTETMYVEDAKDAYICCGATKDVMGNRAKLEKGDVICTAEGEWHKIEFGSGDGYANLVAFMSNPAPNVMNAGDV